MKTEEFINSLSIGDLESFSNILNVYIKLKDYPSITEEGIGYNPNSGYVYMALDNGITICEAFKGVEFLVTNDEEFFFEDYNEALNYLKTLNQ